MIEIIFLTFFFLIFWTFTSNKFNQYDRKNRSTYNSLLHSIIISFSTLINLSKNEINCYNITYFKSYQTDINLSLFLSYLIIDTTHLKKKDGISMYIHHIFLIVMLLVILLNKTYHFCFSIFLINEVSTIFLNLSYIIKKKSLSWLYIISKILFVTSFYYIRIYQNYKVIDIIFGCIKNNDNIYYYSVSLLYMVYLYYLLNIYWSIIIFKKIINLFQK